ncbi:MAG: GNAT family N-acetyltransferase [Lachnospiraceae bacterium]|jgi:GNAT superfamily N-acetyltransferase|uniref:GNAT family N-acetyltransferase n=1 Tax=Candidatus Merdisoma sp. JLR.KK006 TaxID=3112626 RepID=UPI002FF20D35|nr:GNAT family N-acetyltransferase [Lachnospiraceae bacterium]
MDRIQKAAYSDISQVAQIYEHILDKEEQGETTIGWIRGVYPTKRTALEALEAGELFVMLQDETVVAAAKINQSQVPEYKYASWKYPDAPEDQVMVLHTLVVDPAFSGKGYGTEFVSFYEEYALKHHCHYLRMDTNARNLAARRLYKHLGYREAGIVSCIFNGIPDVQLVCLEKLLK